MPLLSNMISTSNNTDKIQKFFIQDVNYNSLKEKLTKIYNDA